MTDIPKLTDEPEACMSGWEVEQPDMVSVPRDVWEAIRHDFERLAVIYPDWTSERIALVRLRARQALARLSTTADEGETP